MDMNDAMLNRFTVNLSNRDKALLTEITRQDAFIIGTDNFSTTLRRLIRQEAQRRQIDPTMLLEEPIPS